MLIARMKRVWLGIQRGWTKGGPNRLSTMLRSVMARANRGSTAGLARRPFFVLRRKKGEWRVALPRGRLGGVRVRRPSTKRLEEIRPGDGRAIQEGDVVTFKGDETWYMLVEGLYP